MPVIASQVPKDHPLSQILTPTLYITSHSHYETHKETILTYKFTHTIQCAHPLSRDLISTPNQHTVAHGCAGNKHPPLDFCVPVYVRNTPGTRKNFGTSGTEPSPRHLNIHGSNFGKQDAHSHTLCTQHRHKSNHQNGPQGRLLHLRLSL